MADRFIESDSKCRNEELSSDQASEMADRSDGSLIRRFRRGEADAATALYLRYAHRLGALAEAKTGKDLKTRFDPEDIVQSVFRTFFRRVSGGNYDVPDGEELWGLLLVVTLNKTRKQAAYHRAGKRSVGKTTNDGEFLEQGQAARDRDSLSELRQVIDEFTETLEPLHQEIIDLRVAGYEVAEIAEKLQKSKRTVERILQRIRATLRDQIND